MQIFKKLGLALAGVVAVLLLGGFAVSEYRLRATPEVTPPRLEIPRDRASLAEGRRLALTRGCLGCHGRDGGGQVFIDEPLLATVAASNLTTLFGERPPAALDAAIRHGVGLDGRALVIMPSAMFSYLTDADTAKIIGYLATLPEVERDLPARSVGPLARAFFIAGRFQSAPAMVAERPPLRHDPAAEPELARGEYLAMTACSECHGADLAGSGDPEFPTPDLTIAAAYTFEDFARLMTTGEAAGGRELGVMSEVARGRFAHFTESEIAALHAFLEHRAERVMAAEAGE